MYPFEFVVTIEGQTPFTVTLYSNTYESALLIAQAAYPTAIISDPPAEPVPSIWLLKKSGVVVGVSENSWVVSGNYTQEEVTGFTLATYEDQLRLVFDKERIIADGVDSVTVTVHTTLNVVSVDVDVEGVVETVAISNGVGTVSPIASLAVGEITVSVVNPAQYNLPAIGARQLNIQAVSE